MIFPYLRKHWFNLLSLLIGCAIAFCAGWWVNERAGDPNQRLMDAAYDQIADQSIFNQQSRQELAYAAIRGMLGTINDPYAELIEPDAAKNLTDTFRGEMGVVGLHAENKAQHASISWVSPDGSAGQAGLLAGDVILAIDGKTLDHDADSSEIGLLLRGEPGTSVRLSVQRGEQVIAYDLLREEQRFVSWKILPGDIGYISLSAYNESAALQMRQALDEILQRKPAGLIWDLRHNEGGDMQAAQKILSYFIDDGLLFSAQLTHERSVAFRASGGALAANLPLVVLMDKTSYSAAETSAAAIAETGRGKTVGETSYGKGVIQATMPLPENSMLQMTVARWVSAQGQWYHGKGVSPQIEAHDDPSTTVDEILQKALEVIREP